MVVGMTLEVAPGAGPATGPGIRPDPDGERQNVLATDCLAAPSTPPAPPAETLPFIWLG
jgi:hypothetical protein